MELLENTFSGPTRLLADVEADRLDCVVIYKVDRLSRSALARLHDRLKRLEQRYSVVLNEMEVWEAERMDSAAIETAIVLTKE
jgi:G3E family GTPase